MTSEFHYKNTALYDAPFYVWGIVNLTPDSFHDGGQNNNKGIQHAKRLFQEGANILDIGGASSRPNAKDVPADEEWARIEKTLKQLIDYKTSFKKDTPKRIISSSIKSTQNKPEPYHATGFPKGIIPFGGEFESQRLSTQQNILSPPVISIDTWRADVAKNALEAGADIINDISAFSWEKELLDIVVEHQAGYVLMHCQGTPQDMQNAPKYNNIIDDVMAFFEVKMNELIQRGLPENHIILDLGIGFGKNLEHNLKLLQEIDKFQIFNRPILLGISHKSFFGHLLNIEADKRSSITQVCTALMAQKNILHHRVHDVFETVQSLKLQSYMRPLQNSFCKGSWSPAPTFNVM